MMRAPASCRPRTVIAFTAPCVPTGMNIGVSTVAVRGGHHPGARGAVGAGDAEAERRVGHRAAPQSRLLAAEPACAASRSAASAPAIIPSVKKLRVGVIYGGRSGEHEVSVASAASIFKHLDRTRYEAVPIRIEKDGRWVLADRAPAALSAAEVIEQARLQTARPARRDRDTLVVSHPNEDTLVTIERRPASDAAEGEPDSAVVTGLALDVVFPVLHGPYGEDGTVQGLLELAAVPYVGSGVLASALGMDKAAMKAVFAAHGLPQTAYAVVSHFDWTRRPGEVEARLRDLGLPLFVKPANLGSSVGISKVKAWEALPAALDTAFSLRSQGGGRSGGRRGPRDRVRDPRQRRAGRLAARRGAAVARVLRLRGEVHRRRLADGRARRPRRRAPSPGCRRWRSPPSAPSTAPAWPASTSCCRAAPGRCCSTRSTPSPASRPSACTRRCGRPAASPTPALIDRLIALAIERHAEKRRLRTSAF